MASYHDGRPCGAVAMKEVRCLRGVGPRCPAKCTRGGESINPKEQGRRTSLLTWGAAVWLKWLGPSPPRTRKEFDRADSSRPLERPDQLTGLAAPVDDRGRDRGRADPP